MIIANKHSKILRFYKIKFYDWDFNKIIKRINLGGYLVAPAASSLVEIKKNKNYYNSLLNSKCAIFDSGFFCVLLRIFLIYKPKKFSGFLFLKSFLKSKKIKKKKILLINSSYYQQKKNSELMSANNFKKLFLYIAPFYKNSKISDLKLINYINKCKPRYVLINIGGLKQEPLAFFINKRIKFRISILCLGGAIDFVTGVQSPINEFIDKVYLGWFIRILYNPRIFLIRVFKSLFLIFYFIKKITLKSK
jgi:N-acetylglucosaminyldiphosphoundecaprenol N-acetyl-beta-D-mannosaminyltransferase